MSYRTPQVVALTGATEKQVDYWRRLRLITPTQRWRGSGHRDEWSAETVRTLRAVVMLRASGVSLETITRFGIVDLLGGPFMDWTEYLFIGPDRCVLLSDVHVAATLVNAHRCPVTVLPLASVRLLEPAA